jgi:acyl-CoA dehydrogenase
VALATAYAHQREAFGKRLIEHPLHAETLADMQAGFEAAFQLVFHLTHLLGRSECGQADSDEQACLRLLTPLAKLWTGKLAVDIASECCEAFGGAGYIENTGIPQLLRDAQVYPIWEGTSNVLALDTLRALGKTGVGPILHSVERCLQARRDSALPQALATAASDIRGSLLDATRWLETHGDDSSRLQAGARALAFSLARAVAAALLWRCAVASHAAGDARPGHALLRFLSCPLSHLSNSTFAPAFDLLDPA